MKVEASTYINASSDVVYRLIADYREGHPRILPPQYLHSLEVESGGFGAGTIIRCKLRILGKDQEFRAAVSEPVPGRILVETDLAESIQTTFIVDVEPKTQQTKVTIRTELGVPTNLLKRAQYFAATLFLRRVKRGRSAAD